MSSFMMNSDTTAMLADQIINLVEHNRISRRGSDTHIKPTDKNTIIDACRKWNQKREVPFVYPVNEIVLYEVMEDMNAQALFERYGDDKSECVSPYQGTIRQAKNLPEIYKALNCYLYQCSEGNVPESDLYKALRSICNTLAHCIVNDLPEYQTAVWG
jgi:hypothetical protein